MNARTDHFTALANASALLAQDMPTEWLVYIDGEEQDPCPMFDDAVDAYLEARKLDENWTVTVMEVCRATPHQAAMAEDVTDRIEDAIRHRMGHDDYPEWLEDNRNWDVIETPQRPASLRNLY